MPLGELCISFLKTRKFPEEDNFITVVNTKNGTSEKCFREQYDKTVFAFPVAAINHDFI